MAGLLLAVAFVAGAVALPSIAMADGASADGQTQTAANETAGKNGNAQTVSLTEATAVVTDTSGYHLKATVTNTSDTAWSAGALTLSVNPMFTFNSRTDMQEWAQSESPIPTTSQLGEAAVPALQPGGNATVTIDAGADADALTRMLNWGPKPLLVSYTHDDTTVETHTFLTRSSAGLNNANTPPMQITMVMPLSSGHWTTDGESLESLVTQGTTGTNGDGSSSQSSNGSNGSNTTNNSNNSSTTTSSGTSGTGAAAAAVSTDAAVLDGDHTRFDHTLEQTLTKHPKLQTIADPTYLDALAMPPQTKAIMQPAGFDITAYAAQDNAQRYADAGVTDASWNADAALAHYRSALGDQKAEASAIAWQGKAQWTLKALTEARRQGYTTVVSTHDFESTDTDTVHTGTAIVPTDAGDVTVLVEQRELSNLAKGTATSRKATAETTEAGRLARFVAQSAFYQMEQPYNERNLLVCFDEDADAATVDAFMSAVESATWLESTDLDTLAKASPYTTGDEAKAAVPDDAGLSNTDAAAVANALSALASSRGDITRFRDAILDKSAVSAGSSADGSDSSNGTAQRGARQSSGSRWVGELLAAHDSLALHALAAGGGSDRLAASGTTVLAGAQQLSADVLGGVAITPSEAVTMLSETASMPVTISNDTPYPVTIQVSSITGSPEIVTSRRTTVTVPARSEAQVTFSLRAATSGSATAHITLQDRNGGTFGGAQDTAITCVLKINDKTGFVIIGFAVALGVLGLWRQFNRKKDPDE
ncbi:DUF6049 family protein [Bifidobacterium platyrrhinorum]|uniref:Uncharacterized protein n=1 Tax=Bifidobacterium platyrrhinorum TaxID=2661628 RepID=A0A6L9SU09_9BIFI|nr:DUF6049 family protein [Bifidobacterium platyrrhinorum]NEG55629.1 hypothetical protein [Bifidobacterium platyrrhinorum]